MEKNISFVIAALIVAVVLAGGLFYVVGFNSAPVKIVENKTFVEIPGENQTIEVEVVKEVQIDPRDDALAEFLKEVEDDDSLLRCSGYEYDFDEISVSKLDDAYTLEVDEDEQTVTFKVKLKYDEDDERSCKNTFDVEVFYEDGEDAEVTVL